MKLTRASAALLVATALLACGGNHATQGTRDDHTPVDSDAAAPSGDAATHHPEGEASAPAPAPATVRFFDDFYPTLLHPDYCLGVGDQWTGPLFAGNYELNGNGWGGYQGLSPYASIAPGTYTLRVLAQYADTCEARIDGFPDVPLPAPIATGGAYTVAVSGGGLPELRRRSRERLRA